MSWTAAVRLRLGGLSLDAELEGDARPVAIIGPNGAGKTTLLRTLAGAVVPEAGRVRLGGKLVFDAAAGISLPPEARRVGYVPQGYGLFPHLGALDNVAFGGRGPRTQRREAAAALLAELGCAHLAARAPGALSGGEKQRVALARALMIAPALLLLDEPLAALDAPARRSLRGFLAERLAALGTPAIIVTHDARDVVALGARIYALEAGRVAQQGDAAQLAARPATEFVAEFFAGVAT